MMNTLKWAADWKLTKERIKKKGGYTTWRNQYLKNLVQELCLSDTHFNDIKNKHKHLVTDRLRLHDMFIKVSHYFTRLIAYSVVLVQVGLVPRPQLGSSDRPRSLNCSTGTPTGQVFGLVSVFDPAHFQQYSPRD